MEEEREEEEEQEERKTDEQLSNLDVSRASSCAVLLSDPRDISEGLVNPAFCQDDNQQSSRPRHSTQWGRPMKLPRWPHLSKDRLYGHCRSLSSSVENMTFSDAPVSPLKGSFPFLNLPLNNESFPGGRSPKEETSLQCSRSRGTVIVNYALVRS